VHAAATRQAALDLIATGLNDCAVARRLGVPRTTVRDWRRRPPRRSPGLLCARCWRPARPCRFTPADYAELLGLYLGDGRISQFARTQRLRLSLDARYPGVIADAEALLRRCFPHNRVMRVLADRDHTIVLAVYSQHLACLFPQHGTGKKHDRRVALEPWQDEVVASAPWAFLRGCIRSDGCVFVNRTGRYEYLSYDFRNLSADILDLFERTCVLVGLRPRRYARRIRLYRRSDVAALSEYLGGKA